MRIGIDARPLAHPNSGIGRYTKILVDKLSERSFDLRLYGEPREAASKNSHFASQITDTLSAQFLYGRKAARDDVDVYWSPRHHLPAGKRSVPLVVTIHDLVWQHFPESMDSGRALLDKVLTRSAIHRASAVIAISDFTALDIQRTFPSQAAKIHVISPAATVTPALLEGAPPSSAAIPDPFILFVGTNEPRKNLDRVISAFRSIEKRDYSLVLVTNPGWKQSEAARSITAGEPIIELSGLKDLELAHLYASADFLVMPSLYEGFGLPAAEAIAFGKPVIVSQNSAMSEVAGRAAITVNPTVTAEISQAMIALIEDRQLYQKLASQTHRESEKYSWHKAVTKLTNVFESVVAMG